MKVKDYRQLLKARGFVCREQSKYQGLNVFEKEHLYNKIVCTVIKDTHGKAQSMTFNIYGTLRTPKDMDEFKRAEFDRGYLAKEAEAIYKSFEELKTLKAPKCVYF